MNYSIISELGNREVNEDCVRMYTGNHNKGIFVLCDGLGGHGKGEVASQIVADTMVEYLEGLAIFSATDLSAAFEISQKRLMEKQIELNLRAAMKTTAVVLLINEGSAIWGHIGDSRLYLFYKNKIVLRTLDHSVPQMLVMAGDIKEKQIRNHPDRNRLLRVMGTEWNSQKYDISEPRQLDKCQAFLICSDGFWEYITEKMMCKLLKHSSSAEEWMEAMLLEIKKNGTDQDMDNHSAIAVYL